MNEKWKAVEPEETLKRIDNILLENQFYTQMEWYGMDQSIQSCRAKLLNGKGVNGKGITPAYTMASCKAELMERLQTFQLTPSINRRHFKDEILIGKEFFLPYYNYNKNIIEYFPSNLISTNGIASGNNMEEAIVHALCELVERYAYLKLAKQELKFHRQIEISPIYQNILDKLNIKGILIDISIFNIPVILLFIETNDGFINIKIDCAQTIDLAIERCFTELFQGFDLNNNKINLCAIGTNDLNEEDFYYGLMFLVQICIPKKYINYIKNCYYDNYIFDYQYYNNKEFINNFITKTKEVFGDLYIRDYSFLNFPTVKCNLKNSYEYLFQNQDIHILNILSYLNKNLLMNNNKNIILIYHELIEKINYLIKKNVNNIYNNNLLNSLEEKSLSFQMNFNLFENFNKEE